MICAKFTKCGNAKYISHIDMLKTIVYTLRRAGIRIKYSQGYNPYPLLKFNAPLPLGLASIAEYFTLELAESIDAKDFLLAFNKVSVEGIKLLFAKKCNKNPNFAGRIVASDYIVEASTPLPCKIEHLAQTDCIIEYIQKGVRVQEEISAKILSLKVDGTRLLARLATGSENLRLDRLLTKVNLDFDVCLGLESASRISQYVQGEKGLLNVDEYLKELEL